MLKVENLHVSYGPIEAIHGVSFEIKEREIVSILGSNGAGKTTILKTISGILKPNSGVITFDGKVINGLDPSIIVKHGIIHVPEGRHIFPDLTVKENLLLGGYFLNQKEIKNQLDYVFLTFPILKERINQKAGSLSGGEQQMLAIGRGLMSKPKILLLDEPSLGLAPIIITNIFNILYDLSKKEGLSVLLVEQNAKKALAISDRAYVLMNGVIILSGESKELKDKEEVKKLYLGR
ncbi:MAG: ABC transporter ATP-binding protein [Caldisericia bacterium]|jgi:branched-chain amino acid transport system ATP-binding protein|nr:ABC transporter ATP-binding protein [Caldisericia bacterium]